MNQSFEMIRFHRVINAIDLIDATKNEIMVWMSDDSRTNEPKLEVTFSRTGSPKQARLRAMDNHGTTVYFFDALGNCIDVFNVESEESSEFMAAGHAIVNYLTQKEK